MDHGTTLLIMGGVLALLFCLRVPVAFSLMITGFIGVLMLQGVTPATSTVARQPFESAASYGLIVVPLFIVMGVLAKRGGMAEDGFSLIARFTKRIPGGLAVAGVGACAAFAAVSGSSVATVATLGPIATQEMRRHGYNLGVAAGVVGAAGTLGVMIPPSISLVLYGIVTGEPIGYLLLAGVFPGIMTAVTYSAAIIVRAMMFPHLMGGDNRANDAAATEQLKTVTRRSVNPLNIVKLFVLFTAVMGSIYMGIATPTEAAAIGAGLALLFYIIDFVRLKKGQRAADLRSAFSEGVRVTVMCMALIIGASVFTYALVVAQVPRNFAVWIEGLDYNRYVIAAIILLGFIVLGMFIDTTSLILIAVPIAYPAMMALEFDGIWFGVIVVKAVELGLMTPPLGMNVYIVAGTTPGLSLPQAFKAVLWYLPLDLLNIVLLFIFPEIATWLPDISLAK